jgi:hypothetical protein
VAAVSEGIDTLMHQCGYSRDRATSALMRELSRGDSTRPSDKEVSGKLVLLQNDCRRGIHLSVPMHTAYFRKRSLESYYVFSMF